MKILAVANQKGGVGKSTISVHSGFEGVDRSLKTCVIELDGQGNTSKTLSEYACDVYASELFHKPVKIKSNQLLTLIPVDAALIDVEREDAQVILQFKMNIEALAKDGFDLVVIDCPPALCLRMTAALIVATHVVSPIELDMYSIDGITKMLQTIYGIKEEYNPELEFVGMLPNRCNHLSKQQKETLISLLTEYSHLMIPAKIGIRSSIPEATQEGKPVWQLKTGKDAGAEMKAALKFVFEKIGV